MTPERFRTYLSGTIACEGYTQASFAKQFGFSPQYLGDVLNGRREPGDKILQALGFERIVSYRRRANGK